MSLATKVNESPAAEAVRIANVGWCLLGSQLYAEKKKGGERGEWRKRTGQCLDIVSIGRGAILENDGAATLAVVKLEGEAGALLDVKIRV